MAIVIVHRLSTNPDGGLQHVLNDGHIAGKGAYEELMALWGEYAHLFEIQAVNYR